jgi:hypothetical protein
VAVRPLSSRPPTRPRPPGSTWATSSRTCRSAAPTSARSCSPHGLEVAGCKASRQQFIDALDQDDTFDASGLYGQPIDFTVEDQAQWCLYYVTLEGEEFVPVEGASPVCGERIN